MHTRSHPPLRLGGARQAHDVRHSAEAEEWASVTAPTLVAYGAKSPAVLQQGSRALAEVLPNAELHELKGVSHNVKMNLLAPVLADFFARESQLRPVSRTAGTNQG